VPPVVKRHEHAPEGQVAPVTLVPPVVKRHEHAPEGFLTLLHI
jgi:hypothetical protein